MDEVSLNSDKKTIFKSVNQYLTSHDLEIRDVDNERPWGGFFVIDDSSLHSFLNLFFRDIEFNDVNESSTLSPKILLIQPGKRLSWQYHFRRSEYWTVANGKVGVILSDNDQQKPIQTYDTGELIKIEQGQRHRLVGLDAWAVVAEIWKHADPSNPSDEEDIIRLEDDFGR